MYEVSESYRTAIKQPVIRSEVYGTIGETGFTGQNILEGTFTITNQCSGNENVQIGQVYIGELNVTLRGLTFDRYSLDGYEIRPAYQLKIPEGYEDVPLGVYHVAEANHTAAGIVIKAYDNMAKFDRTCSITNTAGTPYQLALLACDACFLTLATTAAEFSQFANASEILTLYQEGTDIETWRDFIAWVAQACGCFVTCDREGRVAFRAYHQEIDETLYAHHRLQGASYSDYTTRYTGIYVTNLVDNTMTYYNNAPDDGLSYSLGGNPFLQYGTEDGKAIMRRSVLNRLAVINYVPFKISLVDDPRYDLGDVLSFPGGLGDADALFCVTKFVWTYHKSMQLEGVGENPALANARSKTDKNLAGLASKQNDDSMHYYYYVNSAECVIRDGQSAEIINLDFITTKDTHIDFHAELKATIDSTEEIDGDNYTEHDVTGTVTYYLNDEKIAYYPVFTETDGEQLRHLLYVWTSSANVIGNFRVELAAEGGDIILPTGGIHAYWAGQGLVGEIEDTNPKLSDRVTPFVFSIFGDITDSVSMTLQTIATPTAADSLPALDLSVILRGFTESVQTMSGVTYTPYLSTAYLEEVTVPVSGVHWVASEDDQVITTTDIYGVTGFWSYDGGALSYLCSFDHGVTWQGWNGTDWEDDLEMTYATINSLTASEFGSGAVMFKLIFDAAESISDFTVIGGRIND